MPYWSICSSLPTSVPEPIAVPCQTTDDRDVHLFAAVLQLHAQADDGVHASPM
jgi:hypothetical protein